MTKLNEVVAVKLTNGEMLCATYKGNTPGTYESHGLGADAVVLGDIGSAIVGRDPRDPTKLTYSLIPWQVDDMEFARDKIAGIGVPNRMAESEYERVFRRIVTPEVRDIASLQGGPHGKL